MRHPRATLLALSSLLAAPAAWAEPPAAVDAPAPSLDRARAFAAISDGAPLDLTLQPAALSSLLRRLGADKAPEIEKLRLELGVDPLDPALLGPVGVDARAPLAASLFAYDARAHLFQHRVAVPITDGVKLGLLLAGAAASGQAPLVMAPLGSPLAAAGVRATVTEPGTLVAVVRVSRGVAIVDVATPALPGAKLPTPLALAQRTPLAPKRPFSPTGERGARRLVTADATVALYVDGRALPALAAPLAEVHFDLASAGPGLAGLPLAAPPRGDRAGLVDVKPGRALALRRKAAPRCQAAFAKAAASFDDLALAVASPDDGAADVRLGWGAGAKAAGVPLRTVDDGALAPAALARFATAVLSWRAASLTPLTKLSRPAPLRDFATMAETLEQCPALALAATAVRHWPQAIGAALADLDRPRGRGGHFGDDEEGAGAGALRLFAGALGQLRNVDLLVRDATPGTGKLAIAATVGPAARTLVEMLVAAGQPEIARIGKRAVRVFSFGDADDGTGAGATAGVASVEDLPAGTQLVAWASARDTLDWAYAGGAAPVDPSPPLLTLRLDGPKLARALAQRAANESGVTRVGRDSTWMELLATTRAVEGTLRTDHDLLELRLHATFPGPPVPVEKRP